MGQKGIGVKRRVWLEKEDGKMTIITTIPFSLVLPEYCHLSGFDTFISLHVQAWRLIYGLSL
jgi:hypothetical protein